MARESTDKEGGRQVVGHMVSDRTPMKHDVEKSSGRGGALMNGLRVPDRAHDDLKMDHHERAKGPFHGIDGRPSTRR